MEHGETSAELSRSKREDLRRLQWFLLLRVGVISFLLGATALLYFYHQEEAALSPNLLLAAIALAYLFSLISALTLRRLENLALFSHLQVSFDILFITGIVLLTGGLESPFPFLYNLAIINAAILLLRTGALAAAALSALCYGGTVTLLYYQWFPLFSPSPLSPAEEFSFFLRFLSNMSAFFLIAFLSTYLTQRLSRAETLLAERDREVGWLTSLHESIIHSLESGLIITDPAGKINYANSPAGQILNCDTQALVGKKIGTLFPALRSSSSPSVPFEFAIRNGSGQECIVRTSHSPVTDTYGNAIGGLYIIQDVTGVKKLEESLRAMDEFQRLTNSGQPTADSRRRTADGGQPFGGLLGHGEKMVKVYELIRKVADSTSTVLITGESGTGKELVARAIHERGPRRGRPFVPVNCGAIPDSLMESELFGHVRGAFTDAVADHPGLFRQANGGTIFFDEVGELPLSLQVKLLRGLQDQVITPVGGTRSLTVDVRVIAATNKNLEEEVAKGSFREDLYYRLNVIPIPLPPLRERREDLPLLIHHFLERFAAEEGKAVTKVSPRALRILLDYSYPGNVRELENTIRHAVAMADGDTIREMDLPSHLLQSLELRARSAGARLTETQAEGDDFFPKGTGLDDELAAHEKLILKTALEKAEGVQKRAAKLLGINYRSLRHRLQKYHLS